METLSKGILVIIVGLIGGVAVGLQGPMSGTISARLGPVASSFIIHLGGVIASGVVLILIGGEKISAWGELPKPFLFAGIFGLILYLTFSYTLPRVGATTAATLLILAQLIVAILIDHMGWLGVPQHPVNVSRVLGILLLLGGAFLASR
ncbi:MAG: DMT family transporter [Chloroflexota bacterium]